MRLTEGGGSPETRPTGRECLLHPGPGLPPTSRAQQAWLLLGGPQSHGRPPGRTVLPGEEQGHGSGGSRPVHAVVVRLGL